MNQSTTTISRPAYCVSVRRDPRGDAAGSHMSLAKGLRLSEGNISGDPTYIWAFCLVGTHLPAT